MKAIALDGASRSSAMLLRLLCRERGLTPRFREVPHDEVLDAVSGNHRRARDRRRRLRGRRALRARGRPRRGVARRRPDCRSSTRCWPGGPARVGPDDVAVLQESLAQAASRRGPTIARAWSEAHGGDPADYERYLPRDIRYGWAPRSCPACRRSSIARAARSCCRGRFVPGCSSPAPRIAPVAPQRVVSIDRRPAVGRRRRQAPVARRRAPSVRRRAGARARRRRRRAPPGAAPRRRGHLHHRSQRQLHERLRDPLQVLQLLPAARPTRPRATCCRARSSTQKFQETVDLGGVQILLQGGLNPKLPIGWYEDLFRWMKANFPLAIHGLSPEEIRYIAELESLSIAPGDRAADRRRPRLDPGRRRRDPRRRDPLPDLAAQVLDRHLAGRDARGARPGPAHDRDDDVRLRRAAAPPASATSSGCARCRTRPPASPRSSAGRSRRRGRASSCATTRRRMRYLRVFALSRLYLDNFPSLQVSWPTMGPEVGQVALRFGGNDFGSRDDRGERRVAGGRDLQAVGRRHRALHPHRRLHARAGATCATSVWPSPRQRGRGRERCVSARWVVPIRARRSRGRASRSRDDGTVLAVGRRAELRAEFPDAAEERAQGVLLPGLVNAHCHLELSAPRRQRRRAARVCSPGRRR